MGLYVSFYTENAETPESNKLENIEQLTFLGDTGLNYHTVPHITTFPGRKLEDFNDEWGGDPRTFSEVTQVDFANWRNSLMREYENSRFLTEYLNTVDSVERHLQEGHRVYCELI